MFTLTREPLNRSIRADGETAESIMPVVRTGSLDPRRGPWPTGEKGRSRARKPGRRTGRHPPPRFR